MRKFKVVKKWPGGPEVGTELLNNRIDDSVFYHPGCIKSWVEHELEGFVEEVNEPEYYWTMTEWGNVAQYAKETTAIPSWLRFATKESAEKFAKALKELHGKDVQCAVDADDATQGDLLINLIDAINDRVK